MSYNKDIDYQEKINEAVEKGDYLSAAKYEKSRNEKIDSEGLDYKKTNRFTGWLDETDYSTQLINQMDRGASRDTVSKTLKKRVEKASGTEGLSQYTYDNVYDKAIEYIMGADGFKYDEEREEYKGTRNKDIDALLKKILTRKEFSYNPFEDDMYKYYKEAYLREGERSMEDLLGKLSVNTGGNVNSYAIGAAQTASDYYNSKVADIIPELYDMNYKMYLDSVKRDFDNIDVLRNLEEDEYKKYLDTIDSFEKDREFDYKQFVDFMDDEKYKKKTELEAERYQTEAERKKEVEDREYNLLLDKFENEKEEYKLDYDLELKKILSDEEDEQKDREQKKEKDEIDQALETWKILGYLDPKSAAILNLQPYLRVKD